jgi:hypothetical protein
VYYHLNSVLIKVVCHGVLNMNNSPLKSRLGIVETNKKTISNDFTKEGRIALGYVLQQLEEKGLITRYEDITLEIKRVGRFTNSDIEKIDRNEYPTYLIGMIVKLEWHQVFYLCERIYAKFLKEMEYYGGTVATLEDARQAFTDEINLIMEEENLAYHFVNGLFSRRGRAQTQKALERVGTILSDPRLENVRKIYNKAKSAFDKRPEADVENCVKDAVCALELCLEILAPKPVGKDFSATIKRLQGNSLNQIPPPIGESMIKIYGYRGSGANVAHGSNDGNKVTILEAELVLSMVATYITYLVDLMPLEDDIPF